MQSEVAAFIGLLANTYTRATWMTTTTLIRSRRRRHIAGCIEQMRVVRAPVIIQLPLRRRA